MNQILSVDEPKKEKNKKVKQKQPKNRGPIEITKVAVFFAISLILFGTFLIGSGSYSMYQIAKSETVGTKPTIFVEDISETQIKLQVTHDKDLSRVTYQWNDGEVVELDAQGKRSIEQTIEIPTGENTLNVYAIDVEGQEISYPKTYSVIGDITINIEEGSGGTIKISAQGKETLSYLTYRWDEGDETRIDINDTQTEQTIEAIKGDHTLTVVVVDINNKTGRKEQQVKGVTKPTVEITNGGDHFNVKASDEEGITRIEFKFNEGKESQKMQAIQLDQVYESAEERKEFEYQFPIVEGENTLEVTVYNESGETETAGALIRN